MVSPFHSEHPRARENNIDFLRVALATLVILSHAYQLVLGGGETKDPLFRVTGGQTSFGHVAVNCFFTLSGFLIAQSWFRAPRLCAFFKKRVLRIFPGYIAAMLFCGLVVVPIASGSLNLSLLPRQVGKTVVQSIILHPFSPIIPVFGSNPMPARVNASMWTIRIEFWCYALLALLGLTKILRTRFFWVVLGAAFVAYQAVTFHHFKEWPNALGYLWGPLAEWPRFLTYFWAGTLFFQLRSRIPFSTVLAAVCASVSVSAVLVPHALSMVMPWTGTYLLFFLAFHPRLRFEHFGKHGDFSYGMYLYAYPVQQLLVQSIGSAIGTTAHFFLTTLLTFPLAFLSWHLVEKYFLRFKRSGPAASLIPPKI